MRKQTSKVKIINSLRKYRKIKGLTQREVAKLLGLKSQSQLSRWERGVSLPSTLNLFKLSALYNTMVDALFIDFLRKLRKEFAKKRSSSREKESKEELL